MPETPYNFMPRTYFASSLLLPSINNRARWPDINLRQLICCAKNARKILLQKLLPIDRLSARAGALCAAAAADGGAREREREKKGCAVNYVYN